MISAKNTIKLTALATGLSAISLCTAPAAQARLGEDFNSFRRKIEKAYQLKSQNEQNGRKYYMYTLILDKRTKEAVPNFAAGMTITVINGHVAGQSILLRIGDSLEAGKAIVAAYALDFTYEALGLPNPKNKQSVERELQTYKNTVNMVLSGQNQKIRYPNTAGQITVSKKGDLDIVLAALPDLGMPAAGVAQTAAPALPIVPGATFGSATSIDPHQPGTAQGDGQPGSKPASAVKKTPPR